MWAHGVSGAGEKEKKLQKKLKISPDWVLIIQKRMSVYDILFIFSNFILLFIQLS